MATTYSTNLGIALPGSGEQSGTWGVTTNTNLGTLIEQAVSGYETQAITDGSDTTITIPNGATGVARNMYLELTGSLSAARTLLVPVNKKLYFIYNNTTGGYAVTVKVSGQTGVSVPNGKKVVLTSNGTDVVLAINHLIGTVTGDVTGDLTGRVILSGSTIPSNGWYLPSANVAGLATNSTQRVTVSANGLVTINAPAAATQALTVTGGAATPNTAVSFSATAMTVDCSRGNVFATTFTANVTVAPSISNPQDGQTINWFITQDATGSRTMTWPASFKWPGATAGVLSTAANSVDLLVATYRSSTSAWYVTLLKGFA
jgi:hypothetical protein